MTDQHPITPPAQLVKELQDMGNLDAIQLAYQAGADLELEACCEWVSTILELPGSANCLRSDRRPKPPSDKEQALNALSLIMSRQKGMFDGKPFETVRKVLEALPNDSH